jgi:hypothetical protein
MGLILADNLKGFKMGLDMYLSASRYGIGCLDEEPTDLTKAVNQVTDTKGYQVKNVEIWACDWRKANQIHEWFVQNAQDGEDNCQRHYVEINKLKNLVAICKQVLADHELAEELLPTQAGFFFGATDYDEHYYKELEDTIKKLEPFTTDPSWESWDFHYQSSW